MKAIPTSGSLKAIYPSPRKLRDRRGFLRGENKRGMGGEGQRGVWRDKIDDAHTEVAEAEVVSSGP